LAEVAPLQTEGCLAKRQMSVPLPVETWQKLGVRAVGGAALPAADHNVEAASLISGVNRHFLVYPNYQAVLEYNCVNAYGLSVGVLAERSLKSTRSKKSAAHANTTHR
jgi:membrane-bound lytic murein transglycosylase B